MKKNDDKGEGYPLYPASEDIYSKWQLLENVNPEDITKNKLENEDDGLLNEKDFQDNQTGEDLDIPGNEDDEKEENDGIEDEENNYYSLSGDSHEDLEEDKGE